MAPECAVMHSFVACDVLSPALVEDAAYYWAVPTTIKRNERRTCFNPAQANDLQGESYQWSQCDSGWPGVKIAILAAGRILAELDYVEKPPKPYTKQELKAMFAVMN